jgi:transposase
LTGWVKLERERENGAGPSETELLRTRMKELERENKRLKMERDILKKAAAYFAKEDEENSDG